MAGSGKKGWLSLILFVCVACGDVVDSPFTDSVRTGIRDSNIKQQQYLYNDGTPLKFAIVSDSHQNYDDLEKVVKTINSRNDLDLVMHTGDLTDSSYAMEYDLFVDIFKHLNLPYFVAIGNHDVLGSGKSIYQKIFGPYNFSFEYKEVKFIVFNNIAFDFTLDFDWLLSEIESSSLPVLIFFHIPPFSNDLSDEEHGKFTEALATEKVAAMFYGHDHKFSSFLYNDGNSPKLLQQVPRTEGQQYVEVEINGRTMKVYECIKGSCDEKVNFDF